MRFKRYARCALMRNCFLSADRKQEYSQSNSRIHYRVRWIYTNQCYNQPCLVAVKEKQRAPSPRADHPELGFSSQLVASIDFLKCWSNLRGISRSLQHSSVWLLHFLISNDFSNTIAMIATTFLYFSSWLCATTITTQHLQLQLRLVHVPRSFWRLNNMTHQITVKLSTKLTQRHAQFSFGSSATAH